MGADAAEANDDDERGAEGRETGIRKEDTVACELLKDQLVIVVASSRTGGNAGDLGVFLAGQRERSGCTVFSKLSE